jgi:hypothetical protein
MGHRQIALLARCKGAGDAFSLKPRLLVHSGSIHEITAYNDVVLLILLAAWYD